jgi:hypothetical protein
LGGNGNIASVDIEIKESESQVLIPVQSSATTTWTLCGHCDDDVDDDGDILVEPQQRFSQPQACALVWDGMTAMIIFNSQV